RERAGAFFAGDLRGAEDLAELVDLVGTDLTDVSVALREPLAWPLFNCRRIRAPPPIANTTGHSSRPATPSAPNVSAAAGVEWLPLPIPRCTPSAAPVTAPTTPLTAAPPTAPAASVVTSAARPTVRVTVRTAPLTTPMMTPW